MCAIFCHMGFPMNIAAPAVQVHRVRKQFPNLVKDHTQPSVSIIIFSVRAARASKPTACSMHASVLCFPFCSSAAAAFRPFASCRLAQEDVNRNPDAAGLARVCRHGSPSQLHSLWRCGLLLHNVFACVPLLLLLLLLWQLLPARPTAHRQRVVPAKMQTNLRIMRLRVTQT